MTRFQLVFRTADGDTSELHDNSLSGEPRVDGVHLLDGTIFSYHGRRWLVARQDLDGMIRFVCTPIEDE